MIDFPSLVAKQFVETRRMRNMIDMVLNKVLIVFEEGKVVIVCIRKMCLWADFVIEDLIRWNSLFTEKIESFSMCIYMNMDIQGKKAWQVVL